MEQVKWFDRKFYFDTTQNIFPSILERLEGTPIRLEEKCKSIPTEILAVSFNNTWTIKENIGHLIDLEPLWQQRFEDIASGKSELSPTDLQNSKTNLANYNAKELTDLLRSFREIRKQTMGALEQIDDQMVFRSALHPRLKTPMRIMDLFLFVADHDDHHLARITELSKLLYTHLSIFVSPQTPDGSR